MILTKRKHAEVIRGFGEAIAADLTAMLDEHENYTITHVPTDEAPEKYLFPEFGRSATELLAEAIHKQLNMSNVRVAAVLAQTHEKARKQHACDTDRARLANVAGIYEVCMRELVWGRRLILVDDIVTSGATMEECRQTLFEAGARSVMGLAIARTNRMNAAKVILAEDEWPGSAV